MRFFSLIVGQKNIEKNNKTIQTMQQKTKQPELPYYLAGKSQAQIVADIHAAFDTEVDVLLASAKIAHSLETDCHKQVEKSKHLNALGFTSAKDVKEASAEINRLTKLELENTEKKKLIEAINYFSMHYPNYKFITPDSVKAICQKYGLVLGHADKYIGAIPDKNLTEIERFKVRDEDECYEQVVWGTTFNTVHGWLDRRMVEERYPMPISRKLHYEKEAKNGHRINGRIEKSTFEICAPVTEFDMQNQWIIDGVVSFVKEDPVVLKPVMFNDKKYYLVVTAWGPEASDELVVNHKNN